MYNPPLEELITNLLNDDAGISSETYDSLLNYLAAINEMSLLEETNNEVKSSNGRYYFSQDEDLKCDDLKQHSQSKNNYEYSWKDPNKPQNW